MRSALRYLVSSFLVGILGVGLAWAGSGLVPVSDATKAADEAVNAPALTPEDGGDQEDGGIPGGEADPENGVVLAGAAKESLEPRPTEYGGTWEQNYEKCATLSENFFTQLPDSAAHLASVGSPWPENPSCLYMGGYGIGPMNPITAFDQYDPTEDGIEPTEADPNHGGMDGDPETGYGLWVRSFAVNDGTDTLVMTIIDGEGYFWDYNNKMCGDDDCGIKQISESLGTELGIDPKGIWIAATHSHTAMDFIGGWGFVPDWYMKQVKETIETSIRNAVGSMRPAVLEIGEELARPNNSERRDTYRSAEEQELSWLRAIATEDDSGQPNEGNPDVIATIGTYAAHPTTFDEGRALAHADWPGVFERALEDRFGGIGLQFMTGLGNMSASGGTLMGERLANLVPDTLDGLRLEDADLRVTRSTWAQPTTNVPLNALGVPGFFDRKFLSAPASVQTGKNPDTAPCASASPVSVELPSAAARIGDLFAITTSPGEIFSNVSNTIKEKSGAVVTMPLGQANDALGYMPQSFELNPIGQQGLGFAPEPVGGAVFINYEDSYAVDRCVGDMALEEAIRLLNSIR